MRANRRDLALFNPTIESKLRSCDFLSLRVSDIAHGSIVQSLAEIVQQKTHRPVQFGIIDQARLSLTRWILEASIGPGASFSRADDRTLHTSQPTSTRESLLPRLY